MLKKVTNSKIFKGRCVLATGLGLFVAVTCFSTVATAQQSKSEKQSVVMVAGKPMTSIDSAMVKQLFFSALREKTVENFSLAAELFNRALQIDPANDASLYELANLKKLQNNPIEAQQLLERAVTVNQDNEWYWVALAESYEKSNDLDKLENVFNELIRINPSKVDYYYDKSNALFFQKRYDESLAVDAQIEKMTGLTDDLVAAKQKVYLKQGKVQQAANEVQKMIAVNPGNVRYYLLLSEIYTSNGLTDKSLSVLEDAQKQFPNNGMVHLALADIYREKGNSEASYHQLELAFAVPDLSIDQKIRIIMGYLPKFPDPNARASALELSQILTTTHPTDARAFAVHGDMLLQSSKFPEAKAAYQRAIALDDKVYAVQEQLVRIEIGQNDIDGAIKDGENSLSLFPNQAWMNYLVGAAWEQKKDFKKALGYIKNATSLESQDRELLTLAYSSLGDCYHAQNDYKNSDAAYDKSLSYNPDNVYTLNNYAYYLSVRNAELDKAAEMSKRSNELQPNTASFEDTYAWILFKQKKYGEAKVWIEKALTHDKGPNAVQTEHYGDIMFYIGNVDAAVENWKKAKEYGGQSPVLDRKINEKKYFE